MTIATYIGSALIVVFLVGAFAIIGNGAGWIIQAAAAIPDFIPTAGTVIGAVVGVRLVTKAFGQV